MEADGSDHLTVLNVLKDKRALASFTSNVVSMLLILAGTVITFKFNVMGPRQVDTYVLYYFCKNRGTRIDCKVGLTLKSD